MQRHFSQQAGGGVAVGAVAILIDRADPVAAVRALEAMVAAGIAAPHLALGQAVEAHEHLFRLWGQEKRQRDLGAGIELYPQPGTSFPEDVKVAMSLVPAGKTEPVVRREVSPLVGDNMLRAEAMLPLTNVPAGSYVLKASVTVAGKVVGEASALIKKN